MTVYEVQRAIQDLVNPGDSIDPIDQIREAMIERRDTAIKEFDVESMVLFTYVIFWMSQLQKLEKLSKEALT